MQKHGQELDRGKGAQRQNWLRQKRFAVILSGDDRAANMLVERLNLGEQGSSNQDPSSSAYQYFQLKKLYDLWRKETKNASHKAPIFQPGHENEAIQKGLDPTLAKIMGDLPTLHRALLLLIYGEQFSYAATAQILDISIEQLMGTLATAQRKFGEPDPADIAARVTATVRQYGGEHDAT